MSTIDDLLASFTLDAVGDDHFIGCNAESHTGVIFGGQLLGQAIVAAAAGAPDKTVKTVHTVFARGGSPEAPVELSVDRIHSGRSMASATVTMSQGERLIARSQVLLSADEPDLIRHADPIGEVAGPAESRVLRDGTGEWQIRVVGNADIGDPDQVGPPDLDVWTRFDSAPDDPGISQALLAFATDGFLIGTAMRPHAGVGQSQAHRSLSTGVLSHTLTFHEPWPAARWMLMRHHASSTGRGRAYGRADVFGEDGTFVASFVQDAMIRAMSTGSKL